MHAHEQRPDGKTNAGQRAERPAARPARTAAPGPLGPDAILALQSAAGNRAVSRILAGDQAREEAPDRGPGVEEVLSRPGSPLAPPVRADMESRLGADFSDVRLHTGPEARSSASRIGARAYTSGSHVVIGAGGADEHTLAHELTHVIQQRQGPVDGTDNGSGLRISDPGDRFEREAEANARRVMRGAAPDRPTGEPPASGGADVQRAATGEGGLPVVQRRWKDGTMSGENPAFTADHGRAGTVVVRGLEGTPLYAAANSPSVDPRGWKTLNSAKFTKGASPEKPDGNPYRAVRMHLFNGRLGGPGNDIRNLAPGPGRINSIMSAQAEEPVKRLVENDNKVWLKTTVTYKHDNVNDNDFTSVVPNHIAMEWGVEGDLKSNDSWSSQIPLPVDPLSASDIKLYQNWKGREKQLLQKVDAANDQERAQIVGLLPDIDLRLAVLENYPALYRGADDSSKAQYIMEISKTNRPKFLKSMGVTWDDVSTNDIYTQALKPLSDEGHQSVAADLFQRIKIKMDGTVGSKMHIRYGDSFLKAIGSPEAQARLVEKDGGSGILVRCEEGSRMELVGALDSRKTLDKVLDKVTAPDTFVFHLLDKWAFHMGNTTSADKLKYIGSKIAKWKAKRAKAKWEKAYAAKRKAHDAAEKHEKENPRPERAAKKVKISH